MSRHKKKHPRKTTTLGLSLQPGSAPELDLRRQLNDIRTENRVLRAQVGRLDPVTWPPRYRALINKLTQSLLELEEAASPIKGRVLQPAGRSASSRSLYDEGASTRNARRMADRIVDEVNGVLDGTFNPSLTGRRCRRSPNQCPMSGKVQIARYADHVLRFCCGCGHPFPAGESQ